VNRLPRSGLLFILVSILVGSCSKPVSTRAERVAVLRFDNLTGDPALDWIASAAATILSAEWNGAPRTIALAAASVRDGYRENVSRLAHGYFERRGNKLLFRVLVEDAARHVIKAEESAEGNPLSAVTNIAERIQPGSQAFSTSSPEAVDAWGHGNFERAITLDPDFSLAWLTWIETAAATGNSQQALDVASRALQRITLRSPSDRARIQFAAATLRRDETGRFAALEEIARLSPRDAAAIRMLAQASYTARRFAEAERSFRDLISLNPGDAGTLNTLGYVQALQGEIDRAKASFEEYGRQPGQSVNALDSLGEAMFLNGKFAEAQEAFLKSYRENPAFLDGAPLWKAAHARWLGGDLHAADELIKSYLDVRNRARDPLAVWRQATWLYETGRKEEAVAAIAGTSVELPLMKQQLAVWKDPGTALGRADLDRLRELYEHTDPVNDGLVRTLYAASLFEAGRKEEARELIQLWPLPPIAASPLDSLLYPRFLELRKRLQ
jgi:tetratricopeptide (TPR) repeat protein